MPSAVVGRRNTASREGVGAIVTTPRLPRVRAPQLRGRGWLNTDGRSLSLEDLRGSWVLLDFWTAGCVNCVHVLAEIDDLERRFAGEIAVVGVHSPKFDHEARLDSVMRAVERHGIDHPVLNDADLTTWDAYTARAWPTLVLIDPGGYVVGHWSGEGHRDDIVGRIDELAPGLQSGDHQVAGEAASARTGQTALDVPDPPTVPLRYPARAVVTVRGPAAAPPTLLVADAGNNSIAELGADLETVIRRIGSGERGREDGVGSEATFDEPSGLCPLPSTVAAAVHYDLVVSDTANHLLRGVNLDSGTVATIAGTASPWRRDDGVSALSSPAGLAWWRDRVWIAMSGIHQLWTFDPVTGELAIAAGTGHEGLVDGSPDEAWFAQPSGLAADVERLWVVDAESSSLRWLDDHGLHTAVGSGLFDFGHRDGPASQALLQHPADVAVLDDGTVAIADTYNDAVRRYDPATGEIVTLASGLAEVGGLVDLGGRLLAVESATHRVTPVRVDRPAVVTGGVGAGDGRSPSAGPEPLRVRLRSTDVVLRVGFTPPAGQEFDERYGPSGQLSVTASPPQLLRAGDGSTAELARMLAFDASVESGYLSIAARAVSCDVGGDAGAACHLYRQDWLVEVTVAADGDDRLVLELGS
jgi:thiol-disulfide isomerase/thioredoxin